MTPDETILVLKDLVSIRSTNPMGRDLAGPDYSEAAMADYVQSFLRSFGADTERQEVLPGRPNVIGRLEAGPKAPTLMLEAHMDTVLVENMTIPPFDPVVRGGRLYGRGSCDTKASLASMLVAMKRLARGAGRPRLNLVLAATMDEEFQFTGITHALQRGVRGDLGVCGEPTDLDLVIAHKGAVRWKIHTAGRSTHSSRCDDGVNAIYRIARIVTALERYHEMVLRPRPAHPLVGGPTLSVGRVLGGQTVNTVPDWSYIEIDRRLIPGEMPDQALADVEDYLRRQQEIDFDFRMETPFMKSPPMEISEQERVVQTAAAACRAINGRSRAVGVPYGTDASKMVAAGIPTVIFGPGNILQAHSADEYVEARQVELAAHIHEEIARRLG
ncbi:MAG: M20 family metallopeptidase [Planctomycetes bacterium]|nr:M20 family metallopeptidase [Planctomycetota bacterium]